MAAGSWTFYNDFKEHLAKADVDCNSDTFKCLLTTSSYTPAATHSTIAKRYLKSGKLGKNPCKFIKTINVVL